MTNEELNTAVYNKMAAEQAQYRSWLLTQPPSEILNHCYEYSVREDIVQCMGDTSLSDRQARALLKSPSPLGDVFRELDKCDLGYMDQLRDIIEARANSVLRVEYLKSRQDQR